MNYSNSQPSSGLLGDPSRLCAAISANVTITAENQRGWRNVDGSSKNTPPGGGSWANFYKEHNNENWPLQCSVLGCSNIATDGAHVKNTKYPSKEFIAPLCNDHNHPTNVESMTLKIETVLVPTK